LFELSFKVLGPNALELTWSAGEGEKQWTCTSGHTLLSSILRLSHQLSHWRGECGFTISTEDHALELVFVDLEEDVLSYHIIDHGPSPIDRKKFQRLEYGRIALSEFQETLYASTTDFMLCWGLEGYLECFQQKFALGDYERLAQLLQRPKNLPSEGQEDEWDETENDDEIMGQTMVWESDEEDEIRDEEPEKMTNPEFQKLGWLIKPEK
jgi:hypothetical protein